MRRECRRSDGHRGAKFGVGRTPELLTGTRLPLAPDGRCHLGDQRCERPDDLCREMRAEERAVVDRPAAKQHDRRRIGPRSRNQLDRVEANTDDEVGVGKHGRLDRCARRHASAPRTRVGSNAACLVGAQHGNVVCTANGIDGFDGCCLRRLRLRNDADTGDDDRSMSGSDETMHLTKIVRRNG